MRVGPETGSLATAAAPALAVTARAGSEILEWRIDAAAGGCHILLPPRRRSDSPATEVLADLRAAWIPRSGVDRAPAPIRIVPGPLAHGAAGGPATPAATGNPAPEALLRIEAEIRALAAAAATPAGEAGDPAGAALAPVRQALEAAREAEMEMLRIIATADETLGAIAGDPCEPPPAEGRTALLEARAVTDALADIEARTAALRAEAARPLASPALRATVAAGLVAAAALAAAGFETGLSELHRIALGVAAVVVLPGIAFSVLRVRRLLRSRSEAAILARTRLQRIEEALALFRSAGIRLERDSLTATHLREALSRLEEAATSRRLAASARAALLDEAAERLLNRRRTLLSRPFDALLPEIAASDAAPLCAVASRIEGIAAAFRGAYARLLEERRSLAARAEAIARGLASVDAVIPPEAPPAGASASPATALRSLLAESRGDGSVLLLDRALDPLSDDAFLHFLGRLIETSGGRPIVLLTAQPSRVTLFRARHPDAFAASARLVSPRILSDAEAPDEAAAESAAT